MNQVSRKKSRKFLFQKLFSDSFINNETKLFWESFLIDSFKWTLDNKYINEMESLIKKNEKFLLYIISKYAWKFDVKRMSNTYVFPIYIWACEMLFYNEEIPVKVSINEAIEISKVYWEDSASKIVNWVLAKIYDNIDEIKNDISKNTEIDDKFSFFKK